MKLLVTHNIDCTGDLCDGCIHVRRSAPDPETGKSCIYCALFTHTLYADCHGRYIRCEPCLDGEERAKKVESAVKRLAEVLS